MGINKFSVAVFPLLMLSLMACGKAEPLPVGTLVVGIESSPNRLDPRFATSAISSKIGGLIYSGLMHRSADLSLQPDLAESITQLSPTVYDVKLKKDILFHNGKLFTAADVAFTFNSILNPKTASPKKGSFDKLKKINIINSHHLQLILSEASAPFVGNLTQGIIPAGTKAKEPAGTGAFKLSVIKRGQFIHLLPFARYHAGKPKLSGIRFKIVPDETVRLLELKKGNIHLVMNPITPAVLPWLRKQKGITIVTKAGTNASYIGFNMQDKVLGDIRVRQAIAHAINRKPIIKYLMKGLAIPAESIIAPSNIFYHDMPPTQHNKQLAEKLLDEAGYKKDEQGVRLKLTYKTSKNPTRKRIAEVFAEQLREVGIQLEIKSFEWGTFFGDIKSGNFQIYSLTWVGVADPDIYHYIFHSASLPPTGANRGRYINSKADELIDRGRREPDIKKRQEIYNELQELIQKDKPYIHLWFGVNVAAYSSRLHGFILYPDESLDSLATAVLETAEVKQ